MVLRGRTGQMHETTDTAVRVARIDRHFFPLLQPEARTGYFVSIAVAILLAFSGAFETSDSGIWLRLAYWLLIMLIGATIGTIVSAKILTIKRWAQSFLLSWALVTIFVAVPLIFVVWFITCILFQGGFNLAFLPKLAPAVVSVSAIMAAIMAYLNQVPKESRAENPMADVPRFLNRLPQKLVGAEIYAISSEGHYLRIHTSRGSDLILMKLSDAISELSGIEGSQVHRSWWVAKSAIISVARGEGRAVFTLKGSLKAPVSRTFARALRESGWY